MGIILVSYGYHIVRTCNVRHNSNFACMQICGCLVFNVYDPETERTGDDRRSSLNKHQQSLHTHIKQK